MKWIFSLVIGITTISGYSQDDPCEKLKSSTDEALNYKSRGNNRCEGFFRPEAAGGLSVISFTRGKLAFAPDKDDEIELSFENFPSLETIQVRAQSLLLSDNRFRMDAEIKKDEKFKWPLTEVVRPQKITPEKIGIIGRFKSPDSLKTLYTENKGYVYYPVKSSKSDPGTENQLHLEVRSTAHFQEYGCKVTDLKARYTTNNSPQFVWTKKKVYKDTKFRVSLNPNLRSSLYLIEIIGKDSGGIPGAPCTFLVLLN